MAENEGWAPKSREDWTELFADGILRANSKDAEAKAKEAAAKGDDGGKKDDKEPPAPLTFGERLLGITRDKAS